MQLGEKMQRKQFIKNIMIDKKLDAVLIYSDTKNFAFDLAINNLQPVLFHYYFITEKEDGYLEIDYLLENIPKNFKIIPINEENTVNDLHKFLKQFKRIGLVGNAPWRHLNKIESQIIDITDEAQKILLQKEQTEIDQIKTSAKIISQTLDSLEISLFKEKTEKNLEKHLRKKLLENSEELAFQICITSGKEIKLTTASFPSENKIEDIVIIDAGVIKNGFYSDCTRMFFLNNQEAENNYKKLKQVHYSVIKKISIGTTLGEIVKLYIEKLNDAGLPGKTLEVQDLGHSIGFYLHEQPIFFKPEQENFKLLENMIITLEPEISFENYRLRIEDMVLIKKIPEIITI